MSIAQPCVRAWIWQAVGHRHMDRTTDPAGDPTLLMRQVASGDRQAFTVVYDFVAPIVFGVARRVLRDPAQAEEVAQEVFLELWRTAARFDPERANVRTWAAVMAHRRAVDRVRSEQSDRNRTARQVVPEIDPDPSPSDVTISRDEKRQVVETLETLSAPQREALVLAYYEGLTQQEIAERLEIPLGTVKTRVRDGLARLRNRWEVKR